MPLLYNWVLSRSFATTSPPFPLATNFPVSLPRDFITAHSPRPIQLVQCARALFPPHSCFFFCHQEHSKHWKSGEKVARGWMKKLREIQRTGSRETWELLLRWRFFRQLVMRCVSEEGNFFLFLRGWSSTKWQPTMLEVNLFGWWLMDQRGDVDGTWAEWCWGESVKSWWGQFLSSYGEVGRWDFGFRG